MIVPPAKIDRFLVTLVVNLPEAAVNEIVRRR
jgi:hypothetical protein